MAAAPAAAVPESLAVAARVARAQRSGAGRDHPRWRAIEAAVAAAAQDEALFSTKSAFKDAVLARGMDPIYDASYSGGPSEEQAEKWVREEAKRLWAAVGAPRQAERERLKAAAAAAKKVSAERARAERAQRTAAEVAARAAVAKAATPEAAWARAVGELELPRPSRFLLAVLLEEVADPCYLVNPAGRLKVQALMALLVDEAGTTHGSVNDAPRLSAAGAQLEDALVLALHALFLHALKAGCGDRGLMFQAVLFAALNGGSPASLPTMVLPPEADILRVVGAATAAAGITQPTHPSLFSPPSSSPFLEMMPGRSPRPFDGVLQPLLHRLQKRYLQDLDDEYRPYLRVDVDEQACLKRAESVQRNLRPQERETLGWIAGALIRAMVKRINKASYDVVSAFLPIGAQSAAAAAAVAADADAASGAGARARAGAGAGAGAGDAHAVAPRTPLEEHDRVGRAGAKRRAWKEALKLLVLASFSCEAAGAGVWGGRIARETHGFLTFPSPSFTQFVVTLYTLCREINTLTVFRRSDPELQLLHLRESLRGSATVRRRFSVATTTLVDGGVSSKGVDALFHVAVDWVTLSAYRSFSRLIVDSRLTGAQRRDGGQIRRTVDRRGRAQVEPASGDEGGAAVAWASAGEGGAARNGGGDGKGDGDGDGDGEGEAEGEGDGEGEPSAFEDLECGDANDDADLMGDDVAPDADVEAEDEDDDWEAFYRTADLSQYDRVAAGVFFEGGGRMEEEDATAASYHPSAQPTLSPPPRPRQRARLDAVTESAEGGLAAALGGAFAGVAIEDDE